MIGNLSCWKSSEMSSEWVNDLRAFMRADDRRVDLVLAVLEDALRRLLVLLLGLAHLDRVHLDAEELVLELAVDVEGVGLVDVAAPFGSLRSTRTLPHASDCSVTFAPSRRSPSPSRSRRTPSPRRR